MSLSSYHIITHRVTIIAKKESVRPYQIMGELQPEGLERMLRPVVILRKVVGVDEDGLHVFSDYRRKME